MALYWPHHKVALEIVDDPMNAPVDRDAFPHISVVRATRDEIRDPEGSERVLQRLARAMNAAHPDPTPAERGARRQLLRELDRTLHTSTYIQSLCSDDATRLIAAELDRAEATIARARNDGDASHEEAAPGYDVA